MGRKYTILWHLNMGNANKIYTFYLLIDLFVFDLDKEFPIILKLQWSEYNNFSYVWDYVLFSALTAHMVWNNARRNLKD